MEQEFRALLIDTRDNVAVALEDIPAGATVSISGAGGYTVCAAKPVPFAHKIAVRPLETGGAILKFGVPIGFATTAIAAGEWVHEHNAKSYYVARREGKAK